jgi:hypothetical protein
MQTPIYAAYISGQGRHLSRTRSLLLADYFSSKKDMRATMMEAQHMERDQYQHIPHEDDIDQEANNPEHISFADPLLVDKLSTRKTCRRSQLSQLIRSPLWFFSCVILAMVLVVQILSMSARDHTSTRQGEPNVKLASYEHGFEHDFGG